MFPDKFKKQDKSIMLEVMWVAINTLSYKTLGELRFICIEKVIEIVGEDFSGGESGGRGGGGSKRQS